MPDGSIFPPILSLLQSLGPDFPVLQQVVREDQKRQEALARKPPPHAQLPEDECEEVPVHSADGRWAGSVVQHVGINIFYLGHTF